MSARAVRWSIALLAAALVLAGAAAGYSAFARHPAPGGGGRAKAQQPAAAGDVVGPGTIIRFRRFYKGCGGREEDGAGPAPLGLYGMDRSQIERAFPDARVTHFDRSLVELSVDVPGCPFRSITVTLRDGVVVAYYGTPGHLGPVYRVTGIRAERLSSQERDRLAAGIVLDNPDQLAPLLDGLVP